MLRGGIIHQLGNYLFEVHLGNLLCEFSKFRKPNACSTYKKEN